MTPSMQKKPFCRACAIVGTDTSVGKTTVLCALLRFLSDLNFRVSFFKPAESGLSEIPADRTDTSLLKASSRSDTPSFLCSPYRFLAPLSPHAAAIRENRSIRFDHLVSCFEKLCARSDLVFVEGAGGLMVPFGAHWLFSDLLRRLAIPVLVVGRSALGTINHTLLTVSVLKSLGLSIRGVVLNRVYEKVSLDESSNPQAIETFSDIPVFGVFPYVPPHARHDFAHLSKLAKENLALDALLFSNSQ
jgi:dethiobiotin synthetase